MEILDIIRQFLYKFDPGIYPGLKCASVLIKYLQIDGRSYSYTIYFHKYINQ